jgi:hypothetical protein
VWRPAFKPFFIMLTPHESLEVVSFLLHLPAHAYIRIYAICIRPFHTHPNAYIPLSSAPICRWAAISTSSPFPSSVYLTTFF